MEKKYTWCVTCDSYHWSTDSCGDLYIVYHEDYLRPDGMKIYGDSFEDAGEKYAKFYNEDGDYPLMSGDSITVEIEFNGEKRKFMLSAEADISYDVQEINNL